MTTIQSVYPHLNINGAILDVFITPGLPKKGKYKYPFTPVTALIDTGASESVVDLGLLKSLNLISRSTRDSLFGNGRYDKHDVYDISVLLGDKNPKLFPSSASGVDLTHFQCENIVLQLIIGRDILSKCIFTYDGKRGCFTLTY
jgi:predicted aspartyl protease